MIEVKIQRLSHAEGLPLPAYASEAAVGLDLCAAVPGQIPRIEPGETAMVPTGFCLEIPPEYAGLVFGRSGLAKNKGICIKQGVGVVDPDFRGEILLMLENRSDSIFWYNHGDRLAQLVIVPAPRVQLQEVEELGATARGGGGFGSTGIG